MLLPADASSASTAPASVPAQEPHRRVADSDRPALVIALPPRVTVTSWWVAPRAVRRASARRPVRPAAVARHARGPFGESCRDPPTSIAAAEPRESADRLLFRSASLHDPVFG